MNRSTPDQSVITSREIRLQLPEGELEGSLALPRNAGGIVLFAHGSGSSRFSPRNQFVAEVLQRAGLGTLLMDLLTSGEEAVDQFTRQHRFDIPLLAQRLVGAIDWLGRQPETAGLPIGLFGASTGAAAALRAAAVRPETVRAVVSRGGRPDLAGDALPNVQAPVLLIVGANDEPVITLNESARQQLRAPSKLVLIPGATHLFEEPGTLAKASDLAQEWFLRHLMARPPQETHAGGR